MQSILEFIAVDKSIINDYANSYYHKDAEYFLIRKDEETAGIFGIKKISKTVGEMTLLIFENFKHRILTKTTCKQLLNFPKILGFGTVFLATQYQSMTRLCPRLGMKYLYDHNGERSYK